jgi:Zn-dependent protease with chaperone function
VTTAAPTVLAIEGDSAWIVILAVSTVTLVAVMLLRRLIHRPGGLASGLLFSLPLLLPLIAAFAFDHAALPVVAVLRPINQDLLKQSSDLFHVLFLSNDKNVVTAYALYETAGAWMLWIGLSVSSFMLVRRAIGAFMVRRLIRDSRGLRSDESHVVATVGRLTRRSSLSHAPTVLVMPAGSTGAFAMAGKGGRILIAPELLTELDDQELEGILAHEIAHLEAKDVQVTFSAGFLRDLVAWNPIAHMAYRRLLADREVEADRRAVSLTGDPLAVASGLVRLCELRKGHKTRVSVAVAFNGGRVPSRVSNLLALADGGIVLRGVGATPYLMAACLVAVLGLQVGAQVASQGAGAYAIVLGTAEEPEKGTYWAPGERAAFRQMSKEQRLQRGAIMARREPTDPIAFKAKFKADWIRQWERKTQRIGLGHETPMWDLHQVNLIGGSIGFYRLAPGAI